MYRDGDVRIKHPEFEPPPDGKQSLRELETILVKQRNWSRWFKMKPQPPATHEVFQRFCYVRESLTPWYLLSTGARSI
jgi:hypothetical protein